MKIALIVPSLANKGPVIVAKNISDYLIYQGIYCEVFYFSAIVELEFKCKTTKIGLFDFNVIKNFDVIHTHGIRPDLYSFINPNLKIKRVSTLHNYIRQDLETSLGYSKFKSKIFEFIWNILLLRMNKIVVLSNHAKNYYKDILFNKSIDFIYNGLSFSNNYENVLEQELFDNTKNNGQEIIGTSAYLTYRKGLHQIIEVLPLFKNLIFVIIGDGPEKKNLENLAKQIKVSDRCIFLGYKPNAISYLNNFDYFAIPSYSEGFPLALIEASAHKKATLASNVPVHKEVFDDTQVSFSSLDNNKSMIKAIKSLIKNKNKYSNNIYTKYINNYTLEIMGKNYVHLFKKLCD